MGPDGERFCEKVTFGGLADISPEALSSQNLKSAIRALHILAGVSYYKLYFGSDIDTSIYEMSSLEADLFNQVYSVGLSEFIFTNDLRFQDSPRFSSGQEWSVDLSILPKKAGSLVPVGGGKDSLVALEALKAMGPVSAFFVGDNPIVSNLAEIAGVELIKVSREIDPRLFELNAQGRLNGHVPVTAINSAIAVITAILKGFSWVVFSNERSADFGNNLGGEGFELNHQWSKASEFERRFADLVRLQIDPDIKYFSALRDLNELQILALFKNLPQYFDHFTSCNRAFRIHRASSGGWCGNCDKCAFVFLAGSATIGYQRMKEVFGKDLFFNADLIPSFLGLCGLAGERKPFECVGETDECRAAALELLKDQEVAASPVGLVLSAEFSRLSRRPPSLAETLDRTYEPLGLGAELVRDALAKIGQPNDSG